MGILERMESIWKKVNEMKFMVQYATEVFVIKSQFFKNLPIMYSYDSPKKYVYTNNLGQSIIRDNSNILIISNGNGVLICNEEKYTVSLDGIQDVFDKGAAYYTVMFSDGIKFYPQVLFEDGIYSVVGNLEKNSILERKKLIGFPHPVSFSNGVVYENTLVIDGHKFNINDFVELLKSSNNRDLAQDFGISFL